MKIKNIFLFFYSLSLLIYCTKSQLIEKIELSDGYTRNNLSGSKYYQVTKPFPYIPNYIKITVEGDSSSNYSISYYKYDITFQDRKQLSQQNNRGKVVMWLNKKQIEKEFYLSIELENIHKYNIYITYYDYIDLGLYEQYTYYVNEDNKEMIFQFNFTKYNYEKLTIWAKGEKELNSSINGIDEIFYTKHSKYNCYIIETDIVSFYFIVKGNIGDLINIGSILYQTITTGVPSFETFSYNYYLNNYYYSGFLKKDLMTTNCFSQTEYSDVIVFALDHDNIELPIERDYVAYYRGMKYGTYYCVNLPDEYDELFYTLYYLNSSYINNNNTILYNTILGVEYRLSFPIEYSVAFMPINLNENFKFLTFSIQELNSQNLGLATESSIIICNNYPLCSYDPNNKEKNVEIKRFKNGFESIFTKDELGKDYSPINKKQKLIVIYFNKISELYYYQSTELFINLYTEKSYVKYNLDSDFGYKLIREGQTEKIIFKNNSNGISFFIEKISGDFSISINISNVSVYNYRNFYFFEIFLKQSVSNSFDIYLNITAKKDSVYTFKKKPEIENSKYLQFGIKPYILHNDGNYIFKYENETDINLSLTEYITKDSFKLINIFSPNCKISINNITIYDKFFSVINSHLEYEFFQKIFNINNKNQLLQIHLEDKYKEDKCFLFVSSYNIENDNNALNYSIILDENFPHLFAFNESRYLLKFTFCHGLKNETIDIEFNLLNPGKYEINIFVEGISKKNITNLSSNKTINLEPDYWKNICRVQEKCNISFIVLSKNPKKESYLQIIIKEGKIKNSSDLKMIWIFLIIIG